MILYLLTSICIYPAEEYLNCNNECLSDTDNDGICDQVDIESCGDELVELCPYSYQINNDFVCIIRDVLYFCC